MRNTAAFFRVISGVLIVVALIFASSKIPLRELCHLQLQQNILTVEAAMAWRVKPPTHIAKLTQPAAAQPSR